LTTHEKTDTVYHKQRKIEKDEKLHCSCQVRYRESFYQYNCK